MAVLSEERAAERDRDAQQGGSGRPGLHTGSGAGAGWCSGALPLLAGGGEVGVVRGGAAAAVHHHEEAGARSDHCCAWCVVVGRPGRAVRRPVGGDACGWVVVVVV